MQIDDRHPFDVLADEGWVVLVLVDGVPYTLSKRQAKRARHRRSTTQALAAESRFGLWHATGHSA